MRGTLSPLPLRLLKHRDNFTLLPYANRTLPDCIALPAVILTNCYKKNLINLKMTNGMQHADGYRLCTSFRSNTDAREPGTAFHDMHICHTQRQLFCCTRNLARIGPMSN